MTRAHLAISVLAAGLALATTAAAMPNDGPHGDGQAYCPAPRPAPRPMHHHHGVCPTRARMAGGRGWARHAHFGGSRRAFDRQDDGVSASQAWVYRRELAEHGLNGPRDERRDYDVHPRGMHGAGPPRGLARDGDAWRDAESWRGDRRERGWREAPGGRGYGRGHDGRDGEFVGGHYRFERREFDDRGGSVEGDRDGQRYGWSWGGDGQRAGRDDDRDGAYGRRPTWREGQGGGYEVYRYAGRDENGYLVWPGKPR